MELDVQIVSLGISLLYGMFFYILLEINARFLYSSSNFIKIVCSFLFVLFNSLLYFLILLFVNNGYVHGYFLICLGIGYILCKVIHKKILKK